MNNMIKFYKTKKSLKKFLDENYDTWAYYRYEGRTFRIKRDDKDPVIKYFNEEVKCLKK